MNLTCDSFYTTSSVKCFKMIFGPGLKFQGQKNTSISIFIVVVQTSCTHLSILASGRIVPCNSGEGGMRTEDSCNFTCNTGFEMTGSDVGTCREVSGNWSDNESPCKRGMQPITFKC